MIEESICEFKSIISNGDGGVFSLIENNSIEINYCKFENLSRSSFGGFLFAYN